MLRGHLPLYSFQCLNVSSLWKWFFSVPSGSAVLKRGGEVLQIFGVTPVVGWRKQKRLSGALPQGGVYESCHAHLPVKSHLLLACLLFLFSLKWSRNPSHPRRPLQVPSSGVIDRFPSWSHKEVRIDTVTFIQTRFCSMSAAVFSTVGAVLAHRGSSA